MRPLSQFGKGAAHSAAAAPPITKLRAMPVPVAMARVSQGNTVHKQKEADLHDEFQKFDNHHLAMVWLSRRAAEMATARRRNRCTLPHCPSFNMDPKLLVAMIHCAHGRCWDIPPFAVGERK